MSKYIDAEMKKNIREWALLSPLPVGLVGKQDRELMERLLHRDEERKSNLGKEKRKLPSISETLGKCSTPGLLYVCGDFVEVWLSPESVAIGDGGNSGTPLMGKTPETQESIARRVSHRARKNIRRIVNANRYDGMITLTMALPHKDNPRYYNCVSYDNQCRYEYVRKLLSDFIKRYNKRWGTKLSYLSVFELHNSEKTADCKRGTWHIHLAVHIHKALEHQVRGSWGHGRVKISDFNFTPDGKKRNEVIENPGAYMAEYIGKDGEQFGQAELVNKRRYTVSRNSMRPRKEILDDYEFEGSFDCLEFDGYKWENVFYSSRHVPGTRKFSVSATYRRVAL